MNFGPYELVDFTNDYSYDIAFCPVCNAEADIQSSRVEASQSGISLAISEGALFQVVQCHTPKCSGRFVFRSDFSFIPVNLQEMILLPNIDPFANQAEQRLIRLDWDSWPDDLKFKYIKAWDEKFVTQQEFIAHANISPGNNYLFRFPFGLEGGLYQSQEAHFWQLFEMEKVQHKHLLKRLYPKTIFYESLVNYVAPTPITDADPYIAYPPSSFDTLEAKKKAFLYFIREYNGESISSAVKWKLIKHRITSGSDPVEDVEYQIDMLLNTANNYSRRLHQNLLFENYNAIRAIFKDHFNKIFHSVCTKHFLESKRKKLLSWINRAKKGAALFVDAPMGIGKTYSIAEGLASNPEYSAVIFMPTKRLCHELREKIAERISIHQKRWPTHEDKISPDDADYRFELDEDDEVIEHYKEKYFLDRGVYLFDGINEDECVHYAEIINRYNSGYYRKRDLCDQCDLLEQCRFLKHKNAINKYRIIITTHHMYDFFYQNSAARKIQKGLNEKGKPIYDLRDFFIIDEDFIFKSCYQPVSFTVEALTRYIITFTNFLQDPDFFSSGEVKKRHFQKMDLILGLSVKTMESSIIPPIDKNFKFPANIKTAWEASLKEQDDIMPDEIQQNGFFSPYVGNNLEVIENAIKKGFIVHAYESAGPEKKQIKSILLPNPKQYYFKDRKLPAHVFFDGTKIEDRFIRRKLKGVSFRSLEIKIKKPLWNFEVWQNINTNLPKYKYIYNKPKIETVISGIIEKHGLYERYFIITSKVLKNDIEQFLSQKYPNVFVVVEYYGNLRGINSAKQCTIGILIGSYILPDTVETTLGFDFVHESFRNLPPYPLKIFENIWHWRGSMGTKQYKEEYAEIELLSNAYRHSEYRQALARTRYLSHPVTFYVFSKEPIDSYEPYANKIKDQNYRADIFPPRKKHSNNKYDVIEKKVFDWLRTNESVSATDIYKNYSGLRRQTIGNHLQKMKEDGLLKNYKKYKKRYVSNIYY